MKLKKIIKDYVPNAQSLNTIDKQAKVIQDVYEQVQEFYSWLTSPAYREAFKGAQGSKGEQGERGPQGAKGDRGLDGVPGLPGAKGPKGNDGAVGPQGPAGPRGPQGISGPKGDIGPRGYTGPQGPQGLEGKKGERGDMGEPWGLCGVFDTYDELQAEAVRHDARLYAVASNNKQNGDIYIYRAKYDDFIFLNNIIYDLAFQIIQGPPGRNYLTLTKGEHCDEYGTIDINKEEIIDSKGYLHTNFILDYLKGNGIKSTKWNEDLSDSHTSNLVISFDNGTTATITVKNGKGITGISKTKTNVLVDTYTITFSEGDPFTYDVTNGKGINKIEKTSTNVLTDTYTIYWNDNTTTIYTIVNGRGIVKIDKTNTNVLVDTYTITYNDNTTSIFTVTNGKGISSIALLNTDVLVDTYRITFNDDSHQDYTVTNGRGIININKTRRIGLVDTYTITYNDNTTSTFEVKSCTPYEEAVESGYDKSIETFYGIINGNVWIGPGQNYSDVHDNDDYKYENINVNNPLNIECIQDYIYVIYPADSEFMFNLTMSGFPVPMEPVDTTTIKDYYILKSVNQYDGNFNITI